VAKFAVEGGGGGGDGEGGGGAGGATTIGGTGVELTPPPPQAESEIAKMIEVPTPTLRLFILLLMSATSAQLHTLCAGFAFYSLNIADRHYDNATTVVGGNGSIAVYRISTPGFSIPISFYIVLKPTSWRRSGSGVLF
jgi:hypothetical protein